MPAHRSAWSGGNCLASTAAADMSALDAICSQIYLFSLLLVHKRSTRLTRDTLMYYDETNKRTRRMESGRILNTTQDVLECNAGRTDEELWRRSDGQTKIKPVPAKRSEATAPQMLAMTCSPTCNVCKLCDIPPKRFAIALYH